MYGSTGTVTLPSTGVGVLAAGSAFAGYTVLAILLAVAYVLVIAGGSLLLRSR